MGVLKSSQRLVIDTTTRMLAAIQEAGGNVEAFTWRNLEKMTAAELLEIVSCNMKVKFEVRKDGKVREF